MKDELNLHFSKWSNIVHYWLVRREQRHVCAEYAINADPSIKLLLWIDCAHIKVKI